MNIIFRNFLNWVKLKLGDLILWFTAVVTGPSWALSEKWIALCSYGSMLLKTFPASECEDHSSPFPSMDGLQRISILQGLRRGLGATFRTRQLWSYHWIDVFLFSFSYVGWKQKGHEECSNDPHWFSLSVPLHQTHLDGKL